MLLKVNSEFPGYILNTPTVIDIDGDNSSLEIIIGTSGGNIHVINLDGSAREGYPIPTDSIHGQVENVI